MADSNDFRPSNPASPVEEKIVEYVYGRTSPRESTLIDAQVKTDPNLAEQVEREENLNRALDEFESPDSRGISVDAIMRQLDEDGDLRKRGKLIHISRYIWGSAGAAACIALALLAFNWNGSESNTSDLTADTDDTQEEAEPAPSITFEAFVETFPDERAIAEAIRAFETDLGAHSIGSSSKGFDRCNSLISYLSEGDKEFFDSLERKVFRELDFSGLTNNGSIQSTDNAKESLPEEPELSATVEGSTQKNSYERYLKLSAVDRDRASRVYASKAAENAEGLRDDVNDKDRRRHSSKYVFVSAMIWKYLTENQSMLTVPVDQSPTPEVRKRNMARLIRDEVYRRLIDIYFAEDDFGGMSVTELLYAKNRKKTLKTLSKRITDFVNLDFAQSAAISESAAQRIHDIPKDRLFFYAHMVLRSDLFLSLGGDIPESSGELHELHVEKIDRFLVIISKYIEANGGERPPLGRWDRDRKGQRPDGEGDGKRRGGKRRERGPSEDRRREDRPREGRPNKAPIDGDSE